MIKKGKKYRATKVVKRTSKNEKPYYTFVLGDSEKTNGTWKNKGYYSCTTFSNLKSFVDGDNYTIKEIKGVEINGDFKNLLLDIELEYDADKEFSRTYGAAEELPYYDKKFEIPSAIDIESEELPF